MIKKIKIISVVICALTISACGWLTGDDGIFRDRSNDYRKARETPPLILPEGVSSETIDDSYAIPQISDRSELSEIYVMPRPEVLGEEVDRETVRINRLSEQQWILVNGAPGQVWPRLRGFFNLGGISLLRADAVNGVLETTWIQPAEAELAKERYRLRIVQGVQRGSSEVYVLQMSEGEGSEWPKLSANIERENLMIQQLSQFLADTAIEGSVSMLAQQAIDSSGRVTIEQLQGSESFIRLELPLFRAWASLGLAIEKSGFELEDLDVSQHYYYVRYKHVKKEEDEGWFSGWFGRDEKDTVPGVAYLIHMKEKSAERVEITIEKQGDEVFEEGELSTLLKLIKKHLS